MKLSSRILIKHAPSYLLLSYILYYIFFYILGYILTFSALYSTVTTMYYSTPSLLLLLGGLAVRQSLAGHVLTDDYSGNNFFSGFDFFAGPDPTSGTVQYLDGKTASTVGLVGTLPNNQTFMAVDNVNAYAIPYGRPSVRVTSKKTFNHGLVIADITHMPGGICGTWPAF